MKIDFDEIKEACVRLKKLCIYDRFSFSFSLSYDNEITHTCIDYFMDDQYEANRMDFCTIDDLLKKTEDIVAVKTKSKFKHGESVYIASHGKIYSASIEKEACPDDVERHTYILNLKNGGTMYAMENELFINKNDCIKNSIKILEGQYEG